MDRFWNRRSRWTQSIIVVVIVTLIVVTTILLTTGKEDVGLAEGDRIECPGLSDSDCEKKLCYFHRVLRGPNCFMKRNSFGFRVQNVSGSGSSKQTVHLRNIARETPYGKSLENVIFSLTPINANILRFQFKDANNSRYEVQREFPLLQNPSEDVDAENLTFVVEHSQTPEVFDFQVKRKDSGEILWDSSVGGLLLSNQFLQISSYLPSNNVYGLGEHVHKSLRHDLDFVTWPMFSADRPPETKDDYRNLYGVHPFYTCLEFSGKSHGVLFLNSNAMDVSFMPAPAVTFRTTGGILDFFVFIGDDPEHVIRLYTSLIGKPVMPPYWSLGFQLSRYGHKDLASVREVIERTRKAGIYQTVQHLDIDHMRDHMDFTVYDQTYSGLKDYMEETGKDFGLKWIMILDPAIANEEGYEPYDSGINKSIFIKRSGTWPDSMFPKDLRDVNVTFGKVWPSPYVAFPDFFRQDTKEWWMENIEKHRQTLPFDGLWIDMNEPANFETNELWPPYCTPQKTKECWSLKCPKGDYEDPPYNPMERTYLEGDKQHRLSWKTLCMDSVQGEDSETFRHYDVHSLYGWSQTQPTLEAAQKSTGKRSVVISRSTYPSSGRYAGHWLGDNFSTMEDMKRSIIGMLEFNLFGIPYVGADVCGFNWDTSDDLCKRWMQLGAYYPFYRNHNAIGQKDQDPAILKDDGPELSGMAVKRRLCLNPYLYTLFYRAHVDGSTVVRPLFHEFPTDKETWAMDQEFMWGKSILVTPVLQLDCKSFSKYLPKGDWWLFDEEKSRKEVSSGRIEAESSDDKYTPAHVRGGTVLPYADLSNTTDFGAYPQNIILYVFPNDEDEAEGELFVDDGESKYTIEDEEFLLYKFKYRKCALTISQEKWTENKASISPTVTSVVVFQVKDIGVAYSDDDKNHTYERFEKFKCVRIKVEESLDTFTQLRWGDKNNNC